MAPLPRTACNHSLHTTQLQLFQTNSEELYLFNYFCCVECLYLSEDSSQFVVFTHCAMEGTEIKSDMVTPVLFMNARAFDMLQKIPESMSQCTMEMECLRTSEMDAHEEHQKQETDIERPSYMSSCRHSM
jgi:hypothetical protein